MLLQGKKQKSPSQGTGLSHHLLVRGETGNFQFRKNWHLELKKFGVSFVMTGAVLVFEIVKGSLDEKLPSYEVLKMLKE